MTIARPSKPETSCARPAPEPRSATKPLSPPLQLSVVYRVASLDEIDALNQADLAGFTYARDLHPNLQQLCEKVAALEGAEAAWACASGMGVEAALLLALLQTGDSIAIADGVYGKTGRLAAELGRFGVSTTRFDATKPESLAAALSPRTKVAIAETISNPLVRVADIAGLAKITRSAGCLLAIDHTFAPLLCSPLALGADIVTHSATKLLGGHSDLTLGVIAGSGKVIEQVAQSSSTYGITANPFECWLCLRGLATLALRVRQSSSNALLLARRLESHPGVRRMHYPGLESHPDHSLAQTLLGDRFGSMMAVDLGGRDQADRFIRALAETIPFAPSLGDVATTLSHPCSTSHRGQTADDWQRQGISPGVVRVSVGIEDPDDLWAEFQHGLHSCQAP